MKVMSTSGSDNRPGSEAGIAIGPILFIIAVLGILAAAIAAGSGSFTSGTAQESNRTKAAALIEIGQNLKIGYERVASSLNATSGADFDTIVINENNTSDTVDLFSPIGGGISAPSVTMANDPSSDVWYYPVIDVPRIGTGSAGGGNKVAMLQVSAGVCDEINYRANAIAVPSTPAEAGYSPDGTGAGADLGDLTDSVTENDGANWPTRLQGKPTGCVHNNSSGTPEGYFFYQVIGIR